MIGIPKRESPYGRALAYIATADGEVSSDVLAAHLYPPVIRAAPFGSPKDPRAYNAWRLARSQSDSIARDKASRILRRLTEAGYLESQGGPRVAVWFAEKVAKVGMVRALRLSAPGLNDDPGLLHIRLVEQVALRPPSVAAVLGANPSGRMRQVWGELTAWGVLVPASARYLTPKGADLVASWAS